MRALLFLLFSSLGVVAAASAYGPRQEKFAVYYSDRAPVERFSEYQLLVLDRTYHPPLKELAEGGKLLLGYISLGEIEQVSPYFIRLNQQHLALQENPNWKGSHALDLRDPLWQEIIISQIIPAMLQDGFDGIFLDTIDSALALETDQPEHYPGMHAAVVRTVQAIRQQYPDLKIMVNRGYAVLGEIAPSIDMVLGESVAGDYDFTTRRYRRVEKDLYRLQVSWLKAAQQRNPRLKIYTLDYADPADHETIAEIYRLQRANHFIAYVASIGLNELVDEPPPPSP